MSIYIHDESDNGNNVSVFIKITESINTAIFNDAYEIRRIVFVEEQHFPLSREIDELDSRAIHIVLYYIQQPVACGRVSFCDDVAKICRVAVLMEYRNRGFATAICEKLIAIARIKKSKTIFLHAQLPVIGLYENLGFKVTGQSFLEEGVPHIRMELL